MHALMLLCNTEKDTLCVCACACGRLCALARMCACNSSLLHACMVPQVGTSRVKLCVDGQGSIVHLCP